MPKLKMYNCTLFVHNLPDEHRASNGNTQKTVYLACHSWKEFAELTGTSSAGFCRNYGSACAGEKATKICMNNPHKPYYEIGHTKNGYYPDIIPLPELPEWVRKRL